jgi:hypothetical protein
MRGSGFSENSGEDNEPILNHANLRLCRAEVLRSQCWTELLGTQNRVPGRTAPGKN